VTFDIDVARDTVHRLWAGTILEALTDYISIPALSPSFDADWEKNGHIAEAIRLITEWCRARPIEGLTLEVVALPGCPPVVLLEVASRSDREGTVLLYGHLDKQPEMTGWRPGLGPWTPVLDNGRLYGRGGADDGYAVFAALAAIEACQRAGGSHGRLLVLIEASEESGSPDLPAYVDRLAARIGEPSLVVCLDSGCLTYDRLWVTTSLRGLVVARLEVTVLNEGVHSGDASGIVPSSFRLLRALLDRVEDATTGRIRLPEFHSEIPPARLAEATATGRELPSFARDHYPFFGSTRPMSDDPADQQLAHTWRPALSVTGADGLPSTSLAGNVLRPSTAVKLSFRLPPNVDSMAASDALVRVLTADPPSGATISITDLETADGWDAPPTSPWLRDAINEASRTAYGVDARGFGEGGSIPFMAMLGTRFPAAQFVVTGVLGPGSNAHGPNEFLDISMATRLSLAIAVILDAHARAA
jgi:acetylornithine deacetylase/succinyl-diaminopimelate desuccinylase-like protein